MLNLKCIQMPLDPGAFESISFVGRYVTFKPVNIPDMEFSHKFHRVDDARYFAELLDRLVGVIITDWAAPSKRELKAISILQNYFSNCITLDQDDLFRAFKHRRSHCRLIDPSWTWWDLCIIRVAANNGNVTLNPKFIQKVSTNRSSAIITTENRAIDHQLGTYSPKHAVRLAEHVDRIVEIFHCTNPPTHEQVNALLSDQLELSNYLRPKSHRSLRRVERLLQHGLRAEQVQDPLLLMPHYSAKR